MGTISESKSALRSRLLAARRDLGDAQRAAAGHAICVVALGCPEVADATTVAAFVSVGTEPDIRGLLEDLRERGATVLLPVLLADGDLDWAHYDGAASLGSADRGLLEPSTPRLGLQAVTEADAVLVPATAVDVRGFRLGRGGGSYDRVLARLPTGTFTAALLYEGEIVDAVPTEPHDHAVRAAITPAGIRTLG